MPGEDEESGDVAKDAHQANQGHEDAVTDILVALHSRTTILVHITVQCMYISVQTYL